MNNPNENPDKPDSNLNYDWYVPLSISTGETFESFWMMNNKDEQTFEFRIDFENFIDRTGRRPDGPDNWVV